MSFFKYLKENYKLLIFYFILMIFISTAIYLDRINRVTDANLLYIMLVSLFMFVVYLVLDYIIKTFRIKSLMKFVASEDKTPVLPAPQDYKEEIFLNIINDLYKDYTMSLKNMENKFKENNDFMTAWVHEIKTPITTSKLLIESEEMEDSAFIMSIKEEMEKIEDYVEKVLYYSRSDDFSKDYIISEVYISNIAKESIKKHSLIFIKKHINLVNNIEKNLYVNTDKKWLLFIIDQLVSNSLKYAENNATIKFSTDENHKEVLLIIEDSGSGIKKEDMERLFTKAFTGNNGRNINMKATGLGLYLSQKIAKKLGHYITLESEYGKGTSVCIHFPKWEDYHLTKM
jgi:signal transduction histidine kinase